MTVLNYDINQSECKALTQVANDGSTYGPSRAIEVASSVVDELDWGGILMRGNRQLEVSRHTEVRKE